MRPFMGNLCGFGNCRSNSCEKCYHWNPCIYIGKSHRQFKLPKWRWLINLLYKIESGKDDGGKHVF